VEAAQAGGVTIAGDDMVLSEVIEIDGIRAAIGDGRTLAERPDLHLLIDYARDFAIAPTVVITARSTSAAEVTARFLGSAIHRILLMPIRSSPLSSAAILSPSFRVSARQSEGRSSQSRSKNYGRRLHL
jgi:hypothetical protein